MSKKIYFFINSLESGGGEKVIVTLSNYLIKQNYEVNILLVENNIFYDLDKKIKIHHIGKYSGKEHPIIKLILLPILALKLKKYVKQNNIKLIQSHIYRANYINLISKKLGAKHKVQIVNHGIISDYNKKGFSVYPQKRDNA